MPVAPAWGYAGRRGRRPARVERQGPSTRPIVGCTFHPRASRAPAQEEPIAIITAIGVGTRHAVARALATANQALPDATFRVLDSRVHLDSRGRVVRAEAMIELVQPRPVGDWSPEKLTGLVNPDGEHPLMVRIAAERPFFLDIFPVTWDRWLRRIADTLPPALDPLCPRTDVDHAAARNFALDVGKRLPTGAELRAAWGDARFPWGDRADPHLGRAGTPRWAKLPEVGMHPPNRAGLFDLGAWLWQWTEEGLLFGGTEDGVPRFDARPSDQRVPVGFRLAQDG